MTSDCLSAQVGVEVIAFRLLETVRGRDRDVLSHDERDRAARFRFERDRGRFVSARAALRRLLGERVGCLPSDIQFVYGAAGKPSVRGVSTHFNVSHSEDVALVAFSDGVSALGVDIELPRPGFGGIDIARRFFAPGEVARLMALPAELRDAAFLHCWTRKEALLKAHGGGLTLPLHDFEVSLEPGSPAAIIEPGPALANGSWQLQDVSSCWPGSYAAVAVDSTAPVSITRTIPEEGNQ